MSSNELITRMRAIIADGHPVIVAGLGSGLTARGAARGGRTLSLCTTQQFTAFADCRLPLPFYPAMMLTLSPSEWLPK